MEQRTAAILGASSNPQKYGNKSLRAHRQYGYRVFPVNPNEQEIEGLKCYASLKQVPEPIDRLSVYLPASVTMGLVDEIAEVAPREVWLNPGAESEALVQSLKQRGLNVIEGCSIVDLGISPSAL